MASPDIQIPASDVIVPGSHHLAPFSFPQPSKTIPSNAAEIVSTWVSSFNKIAQNGDSEVSGCFLKTSYWRDLLCLTWDFHNLQGLEEITSILRTQGSGWRIKSVKIDDSNDLRKPTISTFDVDGAVKGVQSFLTVETDVGRGRGVVRLLQDDKDHGKWKVFTLFTTLEELAGFEESVKERRPSGVQHGAQFQRKNWKEMRSAQEQYEEGEPAVLIIGTAVKVFINERLKSDPTYFKVLVKPD